jgi:hypothetical protein
MSITVTSGNFEMPRANLGNDGNLYFGGRTDAGQTGLRLFGGLVNNNIPGGFIDVRTTDNNNGLHIRVDTANGGTEKMLITPTQIRASVPVVNVSDVRVKTNIQQLDGAVERLMSIRGVSFEWMGLPRDACTPKAQSGIGVIAQEVENVFPELVSEGGPNNYKAVNYAGLTAALIEGVRELKKENDALRRRVEALEGAQWQ